VLVEYLDPPHSGSTELLKVVDDRLILGRVFQGPPSPGTGVLDFVLARRYPFEFMTADDHRMLFEQSTKPDLTRLTGRWQGFLVGEAGMSRALFRYVYKTDGNQVINHYRFGPKGGGSAPVLDKGDRLESGPAGGGFHDEVRWVNGSWMVGRLHATAAELGAWVPADSEWANPAADSAPTGVAFVLHRIADPGAMAE
jgi:hypothetical protein